VLAALVEKNFCKPVGALVIHVDRMCAVDDDDRLDLQPEPSG
jgi:hypothetical protein